MPEIVQSALAEANWVGHDEPMLDRSDGLASDASMVVAPIYEEELASFHADTDTVDANCVMAAR